jgi:transposase-like protein
MYSRLDAEDVRVIDQELRAGVPQADLAREFGVSPQSISAIATGAAWAHVTGRPQPPLPNRHVLIYEDVRAIDQALREGVRGTVIAKEFGVSDRTVSAIKLGRNWGHVTGREAAPMKFTRKAS